MKNTKDANNKAARKGVNRLAEEPTNEQIAALAHSIWEQEGRPEGRAVEHWLMAELQIRHRPTSAA
jgi:hypothetical protein